MAKRLFETAEHAYLYAKYRFPIAPVVFDPILKYMSKSLKYPFRYAVDVGCGAGQSTEVLSKHFEKVVGVDISVNQIKNAGLSESKPTNIDYRVCKAEDLNFVKSSEVDLLSASQSFHWFDQSRFFEEAKRVLKPGGTLACYCYTDIQIKSNLGSETQNESLTKLLDHFYGQIGPFWDSARDMITRRFDGVVLPFDEFKRLEMNFEHDVTLKYLIGFLTSVSAYQNMLKQHPVGAEDLIEETEQNIVSVFNNKYGSEEIQITVIKPYVILLGRKAAREEN